jgi:xanthine dehydrogenase YagS FAD-binding subunit
MLPLEKFYRIPASEQEREHDLRANEIVTKLDVPRPAGVMGYYEVRQKHSFDWPVATAAAVLNIKNNKVESASAILGHVAAIPWRAKEAESALVGQTVTPDLMDRASRAALQPARSLGRNGYKIQIARVCLKRALLRAGGFEVPPPHPPGVTA